MDLIEFLEQQRVEYLKAFNLVIDKMTSDESFEVFAEILDFKDDVGENLDEVFKLFRHDVFPKKDDSFYDINVNVNPIIFTPVEKTSLNEVEIIMKSFVWNGCEVNFTDIVFNTNCLKNWFKKWIKSEHEEMEKTPQGVIHGVEFIKIEKINKMTFDFGSVSVTALLELLDLFKDNGIKTLTMTASYE